MAISRAERKQWARESFKGLENIVAPSFNLDVTELDENGVRLDVRQSKQHGFFATLLATDAGLTMEENKQFVEAAVDEAGEDLLVGVSLALDNREEMLELVQHAEQVGANYAVLAYPLLFNPKTEDDVYNFARGICDATELGIVVPAYKERVDLTMFHASGVPFELFDRLASIDNVVSLKIGGIEPGLMTECFERYRDKVLVSATFFGMNPLLVETYGAQWSGGWMYEALQSPGQPYAVEFFDLLQQSKMKEAMNIYWHMAPGMATLGWMLDMSGHGVAEHYQLRKYYQWCVGGNGGLTRQPHMNVFHRQKQTIRSSFEAMGIRPTADSEENFFLGRSNYGIT